MSNAASVFLCPFGLIYRGVVQLRNALFERHLFRAWQSPVPVVSIGNLTAGGTGKTPLVDLIVKYCLSIGCKPAIVSRGYLRQSKGVQLVSDGQRVLLGSRAAGDETAMLAWNNPDAIVVVAEKRREGVEFIIRKFKGRVPGVIILDDAFQHRQIARNLDIAIINAREPFAKAKMLPEGRLREPLKNLARADLILLGKVTDEERALDMQKELEKTGRPVLKARLKTGELVCFSGAFKTPDDAPPPESLSVLAFAGIASPQSFLESLKSKGVNIAATRSFRDHEPYTASKLKAVRQEAEKKGLSLVTTEKDYFRLLGTPELLTIITPLPCYYLKIETEIYEGLDTLHTMLREAVG
ncbi:MAG: tetraacyldisaccharide 4'-kinase [Chlorobiaceae bacterium]